MIDHFGNMTITHLWTELVMPSSLYFRLSPIFHKLQLYSPDRKRQMDPMVSTDSLSSSQDVW